MYAMKFLYSDILPLGIEDGQTTILEGFIEQLRQSDKVEIAVGYVSRASLLELEKMTDDYKISSICLNIGMYYIEGMPESTYHEAMRINYKWQKAGMGEIRLVRAFKYHGKIFCFYKNGIVFSAIIGSANLGVLKMEASNRRQYEVSLLIDTPSECVEMVRLVDKLKTDICSVNIKDITSMNLIRETNTSLNNVEDVERIPMAEVGIYTRQLSDISFKLPLKVPSFAERHIDDNKHFTKSNLNVCYAAPRNARKARDWYETQLTVSKEITRIEGYPEKNKPFFVVTDDGYRFKVHTTSDGNKQFSAVGNELLMGRWIKGRLAAAGLVSPVNNTGEDADRRGMITKEMLQAYGCDHLLLTKTTQKATDEDGNFLDVWYFSFEKADDE